MKIENARVKAVDFESEALWLWRHAGGRITGYTEGTTTLSVLLPPGSVGLLPDGLMGRKVTIVIDPTPGEAAYLAWIPGLDPLYVKVTWEQLQAKDRERWERIAQAAIKAR